MGRLRILTSQTYTMNMQIQWHLHCIASVLGRMSMDYLILIVQGGNYKCWRSGELDPVVWISIVVEGIHPCAIVLHRNRRLKKRKSF